MKRLLIGILLAVSLGNFTFAQYPKYKSRKPTPTEIVKLNAQYAKDSIKGTFEYLELNGKTFRGRIDRPITTRRYSSDKVCVR